VSFSGDYLQREEDQGTSVSAFIMVDGASVIGFGD